MTFVFTDHTYNDTRKSLALATRVNLEQLISLVQLQVSGFLADMSADPAVVRLAKSDIAETLLARKALILAKDNDYQAITSLIDRQNFQQLVLAMYLFDWLTLRVKTVQQRALLDDGARCYVAKLTGTDNPA